MLLCEVVTESHDRQAVEEIGYGILAPEDLPQPIQSSRSADEMHPLARTELKIVGRSASYILFAICYLLPRKRL